MFNYNSSYRHVN